MDEESKGVRDEVGFLTIHQRYADLFFPGTSVLHGRARYALFVPWLFEDLSGLVGAAAARALRDRECDIAGRMKGRERNVIGGRVHPEPSSQPPSTVYWNALSVWGILRTMDGRTISRSQAHRILKNKSTSNDDDGQPLLGWISPFVPLPSLPKHWQDGPISLDLTLEEATFLRGKFSQLRSGPEGSLSLLAKLVREKSVATDMWSKEVNEIAGTDRSMLAQARQAASLAAVGRAVYDALVENMCEKTDKRALSGRHRQGLYSVLEEHGHLATKLNLDALERDIGRLPEKLRVVMVETKNWVSSESRKFEVLSEVYTRAESRKGERARLAQTIMAEIGAKSGRETSCSIPWQDRCIIDGSKLG